MALPSNLALNLRTILRSFRAANRFTTVPGGTGKALEAWILMRLALAAKQSGAWHVTLRRGTGAALPRNGVFQFPATRHGIQPSSSSASCFVLLEQLGGGIDLELHGSLQWQGRSEAKHEIDVSVVPAVIAQALRSSNGGFPRGLPVLAVECKDKTSAGTSDEMRETLARMFDLALVTKLSPRWACRIIEAESSNDRYWTAWGRRSPTYRTFFAKGTFAIARAGQFSLGARQMSQHYHIRQVNSVYAPGLAFILSLEGDFRHTLRSIHRF